MIVVCCGGRPVPYSEAGGAAVAQQPLDDLTQLPGADRSILTAVLDQDERIAAAVVGPHGSAVLGTDRRAVTWKDVTLHSWSYEDLTGCVLAVGRFVSWVALRGPAIPVGKVGMSDIRAAPHLIQITDKNRAILVVEALNRLIANPPARLDRTRDNERLAKNLDGVVLVAPGSGEPITYRLMYRPYGPTWPMPPNDAGWSWAPGRTDAAALAGHLGDAVEWFGRTYDAYLTTSRDTITMGGDAINVHVMPKWATFRFEYSLLRPEDRARLAAFADGLRIGLRIQPAGDNSPQREHLLDVAAGLGEAIFWGELELAAERTMPFAKAWQSVARKHPDWTADRVHRECLTVSDVAFDHVRRELTRHGPRQAPWEAPSKDLLKEVVDNLSVRQVVGVIWREAERARADAEASIRRS